MKALLILLMLTSCALPTRRNHKKPVVKKKTSIENIRTCLDDLLTQHGIDAKESLEVCTKIYRRGN